MSIEILENYDEEDLQEKYPNVVLIAENIKVLPSNPEVMNLINVNPTEKETRKLASIELIEDLRPILNADLIEVACVKGWEVVVKKGEFNIGDKCVYIEIDSKLPDIECFDFLKPRGLKVKTIKLKGQISQGICFPLNISFLAYFGYSLAQIKNELLLCESKMLGKDEANYYPTEIGTDLTELLGITKNISKEKFLPVIAKGNFPSFINKTDEERFQNILGLIKNNEKLEVIVREKLDGSSITVFYKNGNFGVCSRNLELTETEGCKFWNTVKKYNLHETLPKYCQDNNIELALQGELIGVGIQNNKYELSDNKIYFFDVIDLENKAYYTENKAFDILFNSLNCLVVPSIFQTTLTSDKETLISWSKRNSRLNEKVKAEGIVIRSLVEQTGVRGTSNGRFSFKVINPEWLLKYDN